MYWYGARSHAGCVTECRVCNPMPLRLPGDLWWKAARPAAATAPALSSVFLLNTVRAGACEPARTMWDMTSSSRAQSHYCLKDSEME